MVQELGAHVCQCQLRTELARLSPVVKLFDDAGIDILKFVAFKNVLEINLWKVLRK